MARNRDRRHILITRFSALGDVAMTIGPTYSVCRTYPDSHFYFLTRPLAAGLFVNPPENLTVIPVDTSDYKGVRGMKRLQSELRLKYKIDCVVDLHDVIRTKLLRFFFLLNGASVSRIHKERRRRKALTRRHDKVMLALRQTTDLYRDVFRRAGFDHNDNFTTLFSEVPPESHCSVQKRPDAVRIAVAPFAKHKGKIYPVERMEEVVAALAARENYEIFLFGSKTVESEWNVMKSWEEKYPSVSAGECGLPMNIQLACLATCDAMITMDSANMHMASLVGLRAVSVWGATHPYCGFYGRGQNPDDAVQLDMTCRPCSVFGNKPCFRGDYHCMNGINPSMILDALDRAVKQKRDAASCGDYPSV